MFFRKSNLFVLWVLINFLLVSGLPVEAQTPTKKDIAGEKLASKALAERLKNNPWANIKGFRSAKFGMNEESVYRAIAKDFRISKSMVFKNTDSIQKVVELRILVPDLFRTGGPALVGYIFGYKSKALMHVAILWGPRASEKVDSRDIIHTANLLRNHFLKKRYKKKGLVRNRALSANKVLVFRGRDKNNHMVKLVLNTPPKTKGMTDEQISNNTQLALYYFLNKNDPDIFTVPD